jgi:Dyp-type peroxidase family
MSNASPACPAVPPCPELVDQRINYADVQGTILRGYRVDHARHFILSVTDPAVARTLIAGLVDGTGGLPRITTARRWKTKPECFVNVGFTCAGLAKLGVAQPQLASFDPSFQKGATDPGIALKVGDVNASDPKSWIGGMSDGAAVHAVLSLWVDDDPEVLERVTATLTAAFEGCMTLLSTHDARALPDNHVHFGYRDNIAQPTVQGAPARKRETPDAQCVVPTGEFLLGYKNASGGTYSQQPPELSTNGSYAAFRILEQDSAAFEAFLTTYAPTVGLQPEALAAKVCGRWRNGNPLVLDPDGTRPVLPTEQLNDFYYRDDTDPAADDRLGLMCPAGSHIRRTNPRDASVTGAGAMIHRIVRRAMPYGPAYDPGDPETADTPRGLVGYFINGSLFNQFEFLQAQWCQQAGFVMSCTQPWAPQNGNAHWNISGEDVFLGVNVPASSSFTLPVAGPASGNRKVRGFSSMITTRGGAYVFMPSITGLRYLATLTDAAAPAGTAAPAA